MLRLISSNFLQRDMAIAARQRAERASWDNVFGSVYEAYRRKLPQIERSGEACAIFQKTGCWHAKIFAAKATEIGLKLLLLPVANDP